MTTITAPEGSRPVAGRLPTWLARLAGVRAGEAGWVVPAMLGVAGLTAILYLVNLTVSGYANTYYSAAALAGSQSWSAWFFGSIDSANFITIDKPPLGTMLIGLSVRLFGLSSSSILLPEALAGVGTVILLMATVRRTFGPAAAVIAGLVSALTPAAVLIFRYNNPDALLTLLLVGSAYAFIRSLERGSLRWVTVAAILVGFGFLTKYLQAWFVLPAFALTWLVATPGTLGRRFVGLVVAFVAVVAASGWWVVVMELIPAANRPYVGGSDTNSVLQLLLGYDGLGRIFGPGGGGPGGGGGGFSGTPGLLRLFNPEFGGQVAWLLPVALASIGIGLVARRRFARNDPTRSAYLMWGLWLAVHVVVFSFMSGIIHTYYAVAMAPAIGALVGGGLVELWRLRERVAWGGIALAAAVTGSAVLAWQLLARTPTFAPGLGVAIVALSVLVGLVLVLSPTGPISRRPALLAAAIGLAIMLAGPAAYAADTIQTAYAGGDPSAGPTALGASGRAGFGGGGINPGGGSAGGGLADGGAGAGAGTGQAGGFGGGLPDRGQVDSALIDYLVANRGNATWIVAVNGANEAGSIELSSGLPVMAMGGFSGGDPAPTLAQLQAYVTSGQLRYVIVGSGGRGGPNGANSEITSWITTNGTVVDSVGNGTLYDLSGAVSSGS